MTLGSSVATIGARLMDEGKWIIMFPEATRSKRGEQKLYKTGARDSRSRPMPLSYRLQLHRAMLARKVVDFHSGRADFSIGPAIVPEAGEDAIALMGRVEKWIEDEMRVIDPDAYDQGVSNAA